MVRGRGASRVTAPTAIIGARAAREPPSRAGCKPPKRDCGVRYRQLRLAHARTRRSRASLTRGLRAAQAQVRLRCALPPAAIGARKEGAPLASFPHTLHAPLASLPYARPASRPSATAVCTTASCDWRTTQPRARRSRASLTHSTSRARGKRLRRARVTADCRLRLAHAALTSLPYAWPASRLSVFVLTSHYWGNLFNLFMYSNISKNAT